MSPSGDRKYSIVNDVLLTSKAVVEVQMKLRSHWQLLCQFKWQFEAGSAVAQSMFCFELGWYLEGHLGAKLSPRAVQELQVGPKMPPRCAQEVPKRLQVEPKRHPRASSWVQEAPKRLQVAAKTRPRGSKLSPRGVQELQVEPKKDPRGAQEASSWTQEASKSSNLSPRRHPRRPEELRNCSPRAFQLHKGPNLEF